MTGLSSSTTQLYKNGVPQPAKGIQEALAEFRVWLMKFENPILVAHNTMYDAEVLCNAIILADGSSDFTVGFIDTLPMLRNVLPNRSSYKLDDLGRDLLSNYRSDTAHDAQCDVEVLKNVIENHCVCNDMLQYSCSMQSLLEKMWYVNMKNTNVQTLHILFQKNIVSKQIQNKIAASGLNIHHLELAHTRDKVNGIKNVLSEKLLDTGKPRVTSNSRIIASITSHFDLTYK